jgi:hypothetical protein
MKIVYDLNWSENSTVWHAIYYDMGTANDYITIYSKKIDLSDNQWKARHDESMPLHCTYQVTPHQFHLYHVTQWRSIYHLDSASILCCSTQVPAERPLHTLYWQDVESLLETRNNKEHGGWIQHFTYLNASKYNILWLLSKMKFNYNIQKTKIVISFFKCQKLLNWSANFQRFMELEAVLLRSQEPALTYPAETGLSWESNSCLAIQEIPHLLWGPNVHHHVHKRFQP